jgi:hypothetical protein
MVSTRHNIIFLSIENLGRFSFVTFSRSLKICRSFFAYFSTASWKVLVELVGLGGKRAVELLRVQILKSGWHPLNLNPLFQYSKC